MLVVVAHMKLLASGWQTVPQMDVFAVTWPILNFGATIIA